MGAVLPLGDPPSPEVLTQAIEALAAGLPIVVPTDTVYGLAADPFHPGASDRVFSAKQRPRDVDLPVLVADVDQALALTHVLSDAAHLLMERYWPGPLPLVLPRRPGL